MNQSPSLSPDPDAGQPEEASDQELESFLDEALTVEEMTQLEQRLRDDPTLARRLADIVRRRDAGVHSLGAIWRRHRIGCPSREHLGAYLLGTLDEIHHQHVRFHVEKIGCRLCQANLADLASRRQESQAAQVSRRRRYFESSAGYLDPNSLPKPADGE